MAEICNPSCNTTQIRTYPIPCKRVESTRKGGFERFFMIDCDSIITDMTSTTEWQALVDNDKLIISPPGFGKVIKPETKKEQLSACSPEEVIDEISGFEWHTKLFDNDTYLDFDFENDIKEGYASKNVMWLGCDGLLYHNYKWVAGTNPGFGGISAEPYRASDPGNIQELHVDVKFNSYQKGTKGIKLSQAVLDILLSA